MSKENNEPNPAWEQSQPQLSNAKRAGGLYENVKMPVKTANILVAVLALVLLLTMYILVQNNGFTVSFDTNGGSNIESCRVLYGETVKAPERPVKEGYEFTGWYIDKECTFPWNIENDKVRRSFTLYAGWQEEL